MRRTQRTNSGFTLVEMLVVAPMIILMLVAIIGVVVMMTGAALRTQARAQLQYDVLAALDQIEQDVRLAVQIEKAPSSLSMAPQLQLTALSTTENPLSAERRMIIRGTCAPAETSLTLDESVTNMVQYSATESGLTRSVKQTECASRAWQKTGTEELIRNAKVQVAKRDDIRCGDLICGVMLEVSARREIAGEDVSFSGSVYVSSLNV